MNIPKKRLGDILIDCNLITKEQLEQALSYQKQRGIKLGAALIELGIVTEDDIIWALGNQLNISFIHLNPDLVSPDVIKLITPEFAKEHKIIPLYKVGNQLSVCMVDPLETEPIEYLASRTQLQINISVCTRNDFEQTYKAIYGQLETDEKVQQAFSDKQTIEERTIPKGIESPEKVINYILGQAIINKVDKIHFEPSEKGVSIRFRTNSVLTKKLEMPIKLHQEIINKLKMLSGISNSSSNISFINASNSNVSVGYFRVNVSNRSINIQVIFYPTLNGEMAILKINDFSNLDERLNKYSKQALENIKNFLKTNHGVLYVTGPRESGRTTTSYYLLMGYDTDAKKVITIENPVQAFVPNITQIQIGQSGVKSYKEALDLALLLDPDIIYVDFVYNEDILNDIAFAALGGKSIITSFMAYDAPSSIVKLLQLSTDPVIIANSLCGFLSQRLIRVLCNECKSPIELPPEIGDRMTKLGLEPKAMKPNGCDKCLKTGYIGRTIITEFLPVSTQLKHVIINSKSYQEFYQFARKNNIPTLEENCLELVSNGITSLDEYYRLF